MGNIRPILLSAMGLCSKNGMVALFKPVILIAPRWILLCQGCIGGIEALQRLWLCSREERRRGHHYWMWTAADAVQQHVGGRSPTPLTPVRSQEAHEVLAALLQSPDWSARCPLGT